MMRFFCMVSSLTNCPSPNNCVKSLYKLKKFFLTIKTPLIRHYYCTECLAKLKENYCSNCKGSDSVEYFLEIPIIPQLLALFKRPNFYNKLNYRFTRQKINENNLEDLYDGKVYKSLPQEFTKEQSNITFTWNTDGVPIFKSSKISIWPFYLMINELPYLERIKKENMILIGLWVGTNKPLPNLFMSVFLKSLKELFNGIYVSVPGLLHRIKIRGIVIIGTCDLCARALFLNMKQFNGDFGCPICTIRTQKIGKTQTYPFINEKPNLRTTKGTKEHAKMANEIGESVIGIKGPSVLSLFVRDYMVSTVIDEMHCIQGHFKKLMKYWFDPKYRTKPYSLFAYIDVINDLIKKLTPPSCIPRIPRKVNDFLYWKFSELKVFLLIFSLPIFRIIMSQEYYEHHLLLVHGITLLTSPSISSNMVEEARKSLKEYGKKFAALYGEKSMTCNLHLISTHLADDVLKFGPLFINSCFVFENMNGILKSFVHGTKYAQLQITSAVINFIHFQELREKYIRPGSEVFNFLKKIELSGTHRRKVKQLCHNIFAVGSYKKFHVTNDFLNKFIAQHIVINPLKCYEFNALLSKSVYYETYEYGNKKKTNSSCVKYLHDEKLNIGIIKKFVHICKCECLTASDTCTVECKCYAIVEKCNINPFFYCNETDSHIPTIYICERTEEEIFIDIKFFCNICFYTLIDDSTYAIESDVLKGLL